VNIIMLNCYRGEAYMKLAIAQGPLGDDSSE
jgi:hypothetical protein